MDHSLTAGIPTYNRKALVTELASTVVATGIEVFVIDDGSTDGTFAALSAVPGIRVDRNETNLGYARTLLRLFEETATPYLLVLSDDDRVLVDNVAPLADFLRAREPAFVSTQFNRDGRLWRGRAEVAELRPAEYKRAAGHAPGLVYRTDAVRPVVDLVRARLDRGCVATTIYPQVVTVAFLLACGEPALWWDRPIAEDGALLPSGIRDEGDPYTALASRWRQEQAFMDFLHEQRSSSPVGERERWQAMLTVQGQLLFAVLRGGLDVERPDLVPYFDAGGKAFYGRTDGPHDWRRRLRRALGVTKRSSA